MSKVSTTFTVEGVPDTLRLLRSIDPELRKRVPDEIKSYAAPMLAELKAEWPNTPALPGWSKKGRTGYRPGSARWKTTLQFRGSRPRNSPVNSWAVLRVRAKHLAGIIADTAQKAHSPQGAAMIAALNARYGSSSRFVWPVVEKHVPEIEAGIEATFERYAEVINRTLGAR